jgi:hypothetical protein
MRLRVALAILLCAAPAYAHEPHTSSPAQSGNEAATTLQRPVTSEEAKAYLTRDSGVSQSSEKVAGERSETTYVFFALIGTALLAFLVLKGSWRRAVKKKE